MKNAKNWKRWALAGGAVVLAVILAAALWRVSRPAPQDPQNAPTAEAAPTPSPTAEPSPTAAPTPSAPPSEAAQPSPPAEPSPSAAPETLPEPQRLCTIAIRCDTVLDHLDELDPDKKELIPADGVLLPGTEVVFSEGESAFDLLKRVCRDQGIHLEFSTTPGYGSAYIEGIGNLYEFDCGERSGWLYQVNGESPDVACSAYTLKEGDAVAFVYSCAWGEDLG